jgi:hypothetical protein
VTSKREISQYTAFESSSPPQWKKDESADFHGKILPADFALWHRKLRSQRFQVLQTAQKRSLAAPVAAPTFVSPAALDPPAKRKPGGQLGAKREPYMTARPRALAAPAAAPMASPAATLETAGRRALAAPAAAPGAAPAANVETDRRRALTAPTAAPLPPPAAGLGPPQKRKPGGQLGAKRGPYMTAKRRRTLSRPER